MNIPTIPMNFAAAQIVKRFPAAMAAVTYCLIFRTENDWISACAALAATLGIPATNNPYYTGGLQYKRWKETYAATVTAIAFDLSAGKDDETGAK